MGLLMVLSLEEFDLAIQFDRVCSMHSTTRQSKFRGIDLFQIHGYLFLKPVHDQSSIEPPAIARRHHIDLIFF
jgi:hypothetical protein